MEPISLDTDSSLTVIGFLKILVLSVMLLLTYLPVGSIDTHHERDLL